MKQPETTHSKYIILPDKFSKLRKSQNLNFPPARERVNAPCIQAATFTSFGWCRAVVRETKSC